MSLPALETSALGKQYHSLWALRDCTLAVPAGSVTALVGPNGAGKTTLLQLAVGLSEPSAGRVLVFGASPRDEPGEVLPRIGFVAQDHPLYRGFRLGELLKFGAALNPRWDDGLARERLDRLGLPLRRKAGTLSGGQQAQVALTLALAKRPELLLLDEPVEFLQSLMEAVADGGLTVVLSSHILADLERVCDHLVILSSSKVQLVGPIDEIVDAHRVLTGIRSNPGAVARVHAVVHESHTERQTTLLVRANGHLYDSRWQVDEVSLEEIVLAYLARRTPLEEALVAP